MTNRSETGKFLGLTFLPLVLMLTAGMFGHQGDARAAASSLEPVDATCFCKVTANGTEVAKPSKGGYIQVIQKEACKNYCRGLWDSSQSQRVTWAKLLPITNTCSISLSMAAAIGTASYENVRGPEVVNLGTLTTNCTCPPGKLVSIAFAGKKYCITSTGTTVPVPDQILQGGYLVQSHLLYQVHGNASCVTICQ